jgi:hypothetical protein
MPNADETEREAARENLGRLARLLIRVHERLVNEKEDQAIRAKARRAIES